MLSMSMTFYLSAEADEELLRALQRHVRQHEAFYAALK